jgi:hypothetical protein
VKEKQIDEMAKDLRESDTCKRLPESICDRRSCSLCQAEILYELGYRKQSEGVWELHKAGSGTCSECHFTQKNVWDYDNWQSFCGQCGAKMKGGEQG